MHHSNSKELIVMNPCSKKAIKFAEEFYEEIIYRTDDVRKIAEFTGYTVDQVLLVKNHLFIHDHCFGNNIKQFEPCFEIADTWQRLSDSQECVQPHDKLLIPHVLSEIRFIIDGLPQYYAHLNACETYNYPKAANDFYSKNLDNNEKSSKRR